MLHETRRPCEFSENLQKQTLFDRFKKAIEQILLTTYIVVSCVPTLERLCKLFETSVRRWTGNIDELKVKNACLNLNTHDMMIAVVGWLEWSPDRLSNILDYLRSHVWSYC